MTTRQESGSPDLPPRPEPTRKTTLVSSLVLAGNGFDDTDCSS